MVRLTTLSFIVASAFIALGCDKNQTDAPKKTVEQYETYCASCHEVGAANAPRRGDKHQWGKRMKKGEDQLLSSIKKGLVAMPPKGGCQSCTDDDFRALIRYMSQE